jgi:hypothetical protein
MRLLNKDTIGNIGFVFNYFRQNIPKGLATTLHVAPSLFKALAGDLVG